VTQLTTGSNTPLGKFYSAIFRAKKNLEVSSIKHGRDICMNKFCIRLLLVLFLSSNCVQAKGPAKLADFGISNGSSVTQGTPNTQCPQFQGFGYPTASDTKILRRAFYTCRIGYAGLYDPAGRTPLWIAEHLVKSDLVGNANRDGLDFIADPDIPSGALPKSDDYANSGFDKGHMAPAADFKNSQAGMIASFQFSNAVPQTPQSNRHIWKDLEESTRELASRRGELYVITGPIYSTIPRVQLKGRVSIPDATYKILIDPKTKSMTGFVVPNTSTPGKDLRIYQVKVREIEKLTGLNFNPDLSQVEADKLESITGGDWVIPHSRNKNRD
jgi:endonuclease G, mitochondrial